MKNRMDKKMAHKIETGQIRLSIIMITVFGVFALECVYLGPMGVRRD